MRIGTCTWKFQNASTCTCTWNPGTCTWSIAYLLHLCLQVRISGQPTNGFRKCCGFRRYRSVSLFCFASYERFCFLTTKWSKWDNSCWSASRFSQPHLMVGFLVTVCHAVQQKMMLNFYFCRLLLLIFWCHIDVVCRRFRDGLDLCNCMHFMIVYYVLDLLYYYHAS